MKVQSINSCNYYNNYNSRNLQEKEPPKPCFQGHGTKIIRKAAFPFALMTFLAAACTKQPPLEPYGGCHYCDSVNFNVNSNSTSSSNSSASASASVNLTFITPSGDTIIVPTPGNDTIGNHYFDFFDFIYGPQVQPDSTQYGFGQVYPVGPNDPNAVHNGNDTIGYATKWEETYSYHNSKDLYPHPAKKVYTVDEKNTTANKGVYDVEATYAFWNPSTEQHDLVTYNYRCERTNGTVNGKPAVISQNKNVPDANIIPDYTCYVPDNGKTYIYKYDEKHNLVGEEVNEAEKDDNGTVYFNHKWKGTSGHFSNEYINLRVLEAKKPEDLGGKK